MIINIHHTDEVITPLLFRLFTVVVCYLTILPMAFIFDGTSGLSTHDQERPKTYVCPYDISYLSESMFSDINTYLITV